MAKWWACSQPFAVDNKNGKYISMAEEPKKNKRPFQIILLDVPMYWI